MHQIRRRPTNHREEQQGIISLFLPHFGAIELTLIASFLAHICAGTPFAIGSPSTIEPSVKNPTHLKLIKRSDRDKTSIIRKMPNIEDYQYLENGRYRLVEEYTANTLDSGEFKVGSEMEFGISERIMLGLDTYSAIVGIPSTSIKYRLFSGDKHSFSVGARAVWLTLKNLSDFAPAKDHFRTLTAKTIRPTIAWTNSISSRLKIHTFWTVGFGGVKADLSEKGKRAFFEAKHPGGNYDDGTTDVSDVLISDSPSDHDASKGAASDAPVESAPGQDINLPQVASKKNQAKKPEQSSNLSRRTLELQTLFGLSTDRFQITGEIIRPGGKKILILTRIERMAIEGLRASSLSLTIAQQWVNHNFQFRFGLGVQYLSLSGIDLDGEKVDETGTNPIPELAFYWRF